MAAHEPRLAGAIAYAPCTDVEARLASVARDRGARRMLPNLTNFLRQSSPKTHLAQYRCPIFLFHANDDSNVSVGESAAFARQLTAAGKTIEFQTVPSGEHYDSMVQQGIPRAVAWLKQQQAK
jgi:dipeptidyl aminopeptidase/acylaminoacyl peptidase